MPDWAAALSVVIALAVVAGLTIIAGKTIHEYTAPENDSSLKETVEWSKQHTK